MVARLCFIFMLLVTASPALAEETTAVPEGSNFALFAIGVAGVLIGRKASTRKQD